MRRSFLAVGSLCLALAVANACGSQPAASATTGPGATGGSRSISSESASSGAPCAGCATPSSCCGGPCANPPNTCGVCDCTPSTCPTTVLASAQIAPEAMAVDSSYVYWAGLDANIHRVPITGGAPIDVLATNQLQVLGLAVTTQALYWIEPDTIWTVALPDGPATEFFQLVQTANPTACSGLAANDDAVAWACGTGIYVQLTGGPRNIVAEGVAPHSIALDAVRLYWSDPGANTIMSVPLAGGMPAQLATSNSPDAIAVDDTNVYWTGQDGVQSVPKQGGSVTQLACALTDPAFLAVDGSNVYWTDLKAGTASKVAKTGGTPVVIASGQAEPFAIAVDATSVYWTATGSQANKFTDGAVVTASK